MYYLPKAWRSMKLGRHFFLCKTIRVSLPKEVKFEKLRISFMIVMILKLVSWNLKDLEW